MAAGKKMQEIGIQFSVYHMHKQPSTENFIPELHREKHMTIANLD